LEVSPIGSQQEVCDVLSYDDLSRLRGSFGFKHLGPIQPRGRVHGRVAELPHTQRPTNIATRPCSAKLLSGAEACLSTAANASPWPPSIARGESVVGPPRQTWPLNHCGFVKRTKPPRQRRGPKNDQFVDAFRSQRLSSCRHVRCRPRSDGRLRAFTFSARRRHQEE